MKRLAVAFAAAILLAACVIAPAARASAGQAYYLETPRHLCLWVKKAVAGSQVIEVPCRVPYSWDKETGAHGAAQLTPLARGVHGNLVMGNIGGRLELVSSQDWRASATFGYGTFSWIDGRVYTIIRFAHQPEFLGEHGRGTVVTLIRRPSKPYSGLFFQSVGGTIT